MGLSALVTRQFDRSIWFRVVLSKNAAFRPLLRVVMNSVVSRRNEFKVRDVVVRLVSVLVVDQLSFLKRSTQVGLHHKTMLVDVPGSVPTSDVAIRMYRATAIPIRVAVTSRNSALLLSPFGVSSQMPKVDVVSGSYAVSGPEMRMGDEPAESAATQLALDWIRVLFGGFNLHARIIPFHTVGR
jgi:hypothetical protein